LEKQASKLRSKLARTTGGGSTLDRATSIIANDGANGDGLDFTQQDMLLKRWQTLRKSSGRRELTGDRVLLAEGLRRELETITGSYTSHVNVDLESMVPAEAHANYVNTLIHGAPEEYEDVDMSKTQSLAIDEILEKKDTLRLVIVSDTHGCERSLTKDDFEPWLFTDGEEEITVTHHQNGDRQLPDGDILLHLGDFAIDRGGIARRNALDRFDKWLSLQPHPIKIVVRGNHDPYQADFSTSKAAYITKPKTIKLGSKVLAVIPFGHGGFSRSKLNRSYTNLLPATCDILATHEPPYNILDKCLSGDRAGSSAIRSAVENMKGLPPKLWVCGHIHEGRGSLRMTFGTKNDTRETTIINAANTNPGRAHHLEYGPVIVDVSDEHGIVDGTEDKRAVRTNTVTKREKKENEQELLLAIDLGLRCGASLFDDSGKLLRYEQLRFSDPEDLYKQAPILIDSWENDANDSNLKTSGEFDKKKVLSYLAIEGGGDLFDAWETSLDNEEKKGIQLVSVRPEEWRAHLLLPKERESSRSCKEAARLIARQVVSDCGNMSKHEGKFKTDAAESVAMGYYMANHLGWIHRQPMVHRYTNGKIIVPK
jgi:Icc-related predicted phosphoesterase